MRILLVCALALMVLPGCTVIGDCCEGVGNACGSVWNACTGVFDGGDDDGSDVAQGEPVYDSGFADDADDTIADAPAGAGRGHGAFRMP